MLKMNLVIDNNIYCSWIDEGRATQIDRTYIDINLWFYFILRRIEIHIKFPLPPTCQPSRDLCGLYSLWIQSGLSRTLHLDVRFSLIASFLNTAITATLVNLGGRLVRRGAFVDDVIPFVHAGVTFQLRAAKVQRLPRVVLKSGLSRYLN